MVTREHATDFQSPNRIHILHLRSQNKMSSRGGNAAAERAAQNQQTIKTLLKLDANKNCADCKRNKRDLLISTTPGLILVY